MESRLILYVGGQAHGCLSSCLNFLLHILCYRVTDVTDVTKLKDPTTISPKAGSAAVA